MRPEPCPTEKELKAFAIGNLSTNALERVELHAGACERCQEILEGFEVHRDELVAVLTRPPPSRPPAIPEPILAVAKAAVDGVSSTDVTLDTGLHYARRLKDGTCRLGRFELLGELGVGAFGYVFRARDLELGRIVAIKVQRSGAFASAEEVSRFLHEARSVASLQHPAIVALYDTGHTDEGVCFLVTEYVEGETLEARLRRARLELRDAATLKADLADAAQYAHLHGVIHRDLKPSNVILDTAGRPHVTDFGLAKRDDGEPSATSTGRLMGTPAYMSPEQAAVKAGAADARTDVYSLGVMLYEMLCGERPFHGNQRLLLLQVLEDEPRPPSAIDHRIPRDLETICLKAMAKSPARRYASAAALAEDLRRYLRGEPIAARPAGPVERLWRWCRRYPLAAMLFVAVSLGAGAGLIYLSSLSSYFVRETALDSARMEADVLEGVWGYYDEVLSGIDAKSKGAKMPPEYVHLRAALPPPAAFTIGAGKRISENEEGLHFRLYGEFPLKPENGPSNDFQREALRVLTALAKQANATSGKLEFHQFVTIEGRSFLNYARGQVMRENCLGCHKGDKPGQRLDWKERDLAGVLLITRPLDRDVQRTQSGLQSAFFVMGGTALVLVGCAVVLLLRTRFRN